MELLQKGKLQGKQCYLLKQSVIYGNTNIGTSCQYKISFMYLLLSVQKHQNLGVNGNTNIKHPHSF